jgi:hypothetical protein
MIFFLNDRGLLLKGNALFTMGQEGDGNGAVFEINECTNSQIIELVGPNVRLVKHIDAVIRYNGHGDTTGGKGYTL